MRGEQTITQINVRKPGAGELRGLKLTDVLQLDVTALATLLPRISSPTLT
ncbi:tail protein, partial [Xanthomonas vasicola pv. vasculorum NCPPB 1326]